MSNCQHEKFDVAANVIRLEDISQFVVEVHVRCAECRTRFRWKGVPKVGLALNGLAVSPDFFELRCGIEPDAHGTSMLGDDPELAFPITEGPE